MLKLELIRDRLDVGIQDTALSQKLMLDPLLTLEKAQKSLRQNEAVKSQQAALHENPVQEPTQVDQMRQEGAQPHHGHRSDVSIADVMLIGRIDALQEMQHASSAIRGDILLTYAYVDLERWSKCTA
eukprot:Em0008g388a